MKETNIKMFEASIKTTETEASNKNFQEDITQMFQRAMVNMLETSKKQSYIKEIERLSKQIGDIKENQMEL